MAKILYVEDNPDTADAVSLILTKEGHSVQTAKDGRTGVGLASKGFDLVLLDIMLPDMSGWDIFGKLRPMMPKTRFAFLSAIPVSSERLAELRKSGVSDYITKPFTKESLLRAVNQILNRPGKDT